MEETIDVRVENEGIYTFEPVSQAGRSWIEDNVEAEPWQWFGGKLCVSDRNLAIHLTQGMMNDGLVVK